MSTVKQRAALRAALSELAEGWYTEEWVAAMLDASPGSNPVRAESAALEVIRSRRRRRAWEARQERFYLTLTCAACGQDFSAIRSDQRTCSHACRQRLYRERLTTRPAA